MNIKDLRGEDGSFSEDKVNDLINQFTDIKGKNEISVPSMKFCSVCNFILKSNIDLYSIVTALIRVSLLMRKVVGISPL
jgi:hypothetical protein